jgi:hypothetical protein
MNPSSWFGAGGDSSLRVLWEDGEYSDHRAGARLPHMWLSDGTGNGNIPVVSAVSRGSADPTDCY